MSIETGINKAIDWKLCVLCQEPNGTLVQNPRTESFQKLLDVVKERASLQEGKYLNIEENLKQFSTEEFIGKKPIWHRGCYSEATNLKSIQQAKDPYSMPCLQEPML